MANLIVDASVASAWCFPDEQTSDTNRVLLAISSGLVAFAPTLWAYEVRNSVLTGIRRKRISQMHAEEFIRSLARLNIRLVEPVSYDNIFVLAQSRGITVYDAAYLDLALRESAQLVSLDDALCQAAVESGVRLFPLTYS